MTSGEGIYKAIKLIIMFYLAYIATLIILSSTGCVLSLNAGIHDHKKLKPEIRLSASRLGRAEETQCNNPKHNIP